MPLLSRLAVQAARAYGILSSRSTNVSASYLVVAGGGGGGGAAADSGGAGGGGAGGYQTSTFTLSTLNTYSITVGAGGVGGAVGSGANGSNSIVSGTGLTTITSIGGGAGRFAGSAVNGLSGGSGGGISSASASFQTGGTGTAGQGNNGGGGFNTFNVPGTGGGGASAVGGSISNVTNAAAGVGGAGSSSSISGSSVTYAGGGGGGNYAATANTPTGGAGGAGGGGAGGNPAVAGTAGTANLGGGGGGAGSKTASGAAGGSGGSGVVIISYTSATPKFVGGTLTTSGGNQIHTFTSSGALSPLTPVTASYLVVAGGGGAVGNRNGGGGAGGLLTSSTTLYSGATYVVTVGAGGAGGAGNAGPTSAQDGSNSVLSGTGLTTLTATGGGGGGGTNNPSSGRAGGSGGGAGGDNATGATGGTGVSGQGFAGGTSATGGGAGGGGASAVGSNGTSNTGGNGGAGTASSITGTSVTYAGGGGGGATTTAGTGGAGGGGNGASGSPTTQLAGVSGTQNLGGGGGGGSNYGSTPVTQASGGSGTVIISYAGSQVFNGGLVTSSGGNTIHTFNATGALTPLTNNLTNSLRFRSSASASLNRTPASATNRKTWTWSGWVKRGTLGTTQRLFCAGSTDAVSPYETLVGFNTLDQLSLTINGNGATGGSAVTSSVFRDPSAWYHIVAYVDMASSGQGNKARIYVNGNQQTVTYTSLTTTDNTEVNNNVIHRIAANSYALSGYFDGYMTDINFIDGQALEPYYFGNNDAYGNWKPIKYTGMYGTNGFYLTFADTSALTSGSNTGVGKDFSGNGNYWNSSNISITAGVTYDAMTDVPTNTSATVANYPTWNPLKLYTSSALTLSNANLTASDTTSALSTRIATMSLPTTGKWYWEVTVTAISAANGFVGVIDATTANGNTFIQSKGTYRSNGDITNLAGTLQTAGTSYTSGDIIGVAVDVDAGTVKFYKNNSGQGGTPSFSFTAGTELFPYVATDNNAGTKTFDANFGQRPFSYTPPTGFVALNTFNLPTPTILQGNKYMDATLYTGTGTTQVLVNQAQFKPDFVWMKGRSNVRNNNLYDSVRGTTKELNSNNALAETTNATGLTAFNSNGWTIGSDGGINTSSETYVGWQWQAGQGSTSSNTSGSITSTVSVNTTAGFSVVTYTGTGANATVGHGLGVAPKMVIVKRRNSTGDWLVWNSVIAASNAANVLFLNATDAQSALSTNFNSTAPTSTVFSVGTNAATNASGGTHVAYCWAEIAGFSSFGSYTGNGSTDGTFVYLGFRPKFILYKNASYAGTSWAMLDSSRNTYNVLNARLFADSSSAEDTSVSPMDFTSNGFKVRSTNDGVNRNGDTIIYMAFAENPFKNANAR